MLVLRAVGGVLGARRTWGGALAPLSTLIAILIAGATSPARGQQGSITADAFHPQLSTPELLQPFLQDVSAGHDAFNAERDGQQIEARLRVLADRLTKSPDAAGSIADWLLTRDFKGGRLRADAAGGAAVMSSGSMEIRRTSGSAAQPTLDAAAFARELRGLLSDLRAVSAAEFSVTAVDPADGCADATGACSLSTDVRFDIVGSGTSAWRAEHVGTWRMTWQRTGTEWRAAGWSLVSDVSSLAKAPVFTEITEAALGGTDSFRHQLSTALDPWMGAIDGVLTRDSNGHHGVSVGDADGDGLDDIYVAQPAALPNRLFRHKPDGTFEDVTDRAGVGVLDDTAASLFADVDNDGDEDLIVAGATRPMLFLNDGTGRFAPAPNAFTLERPLQGSITSIAMADYDRDGLLDLYVCVYSYFYGAGEDKAGTPAPYYDARNGPPGILFHNDGNGRFTESTTKAGLTEGNDRYHFAASWADYDNDGWPDLLVANDFGTNNLYRNRGDGTFEDVAEKAGVLDYAAGMSATFFDYDNDGLLDIYTGNMWTPSGLRVTASPKFLPEAPADVRAFYRHHVAGNSLFRNLGNGRFEEKTSDARAGVGHWAWSSDAIDFDSDGWDDIYIANGMLSRGDTGPDLESFFWRQVVARSPLTRARGTPYDDAWRAINQLLIKGSIASRQRNVLLRNDGKGGFDEVSGTAGLDLDQDGRSFAEMDIDGDGDPDLVVMAARNAPQLRIFRNDFAPRGATLAIRLTGTKSNRDAVGARVTVQTDLFTRTKVVHAGSGFLSEHSKELLFGLGASQRIVRMEVAWPSGEKQTFTNVGLNRRLRLTEGGDLAVSTWDGASAPLSPGHEAPAPQVSESGAGALRPGQAAWLFEPFPAPDFSLPDLQGRTRSLTALKGHPALVLLWSLDAPASRETLQSLARARATLASAGIGLVTISVDAPDRLASARGSLPGDLPIVAATRDVALSYAIVNHQLFMNRQDLALPTVLLLDKDGSIVRVYRHAIDTDRMAADAGTIDASPADRLARALPFQGTFYGNVPLRNYLPYGRELLDQGLDRAAVVAFERAAQAKPSADTLYRLGTLLLKTGETARARSAFEGALSMKPDLAEANNDLGTLLAQDGQLDAAIQRFREALAATPDYPDALNNLGYALLLTGQESEARSLYEKALALQPDFPEALNNLGLLYGRAGDLDRAEQHFRDALARRPTYGEAANNVALVLVARGNTEAAISLLQDFLARVPDYEPAYITLAKIHYSAGRTDEALRTLDRVLQRNPVNPLALELANKWKQQ